MLGLSLDGDTSIVHLWPILKPKYFFSVFRPDPQTIAQEIYGNSNYNNYGVPPTPPVRGAQVITYAPQPQPAPTQAPPVAYTSAPERSPKPNVMKMNLGGAKQVCNIYR